MNFHAGPDDMIMDFNPDNNEIDEKLYNQIVD